MDKNYSKVGILSNWVKDDNGFFICSICKKHPYLNHITNYCPNCGRFMDNPNNPIDVYKGDWVTIPTPPTFQYDYSFDTIKGEVVTIKEDFTSTTELKNYIIGIVSNYNFINVSFKVELTNENSLKQSMIDAGIEVEEFVYKGTPYRWFD